MGFLEKKSEDNFFLHTKIKPNSKNQRILDNNDYLIIFLRSKPVKNKANNELINETLTLWLESGGVPNDKTKNYSFNYNGYDC